MKCKYCGYETNPKRKDGSKIYKVSRKFCGANCRDTFNKLQINKK